MNTNELVGLHVVADASLQRRERGMVLLGGSPLRIVRISEKGADLVDELLAGAPVPPGKGATSLVRRLLDGGLLQPVPEPNRFSSRDVTVVVPVFGSLEAGLLDGIGEAAHIIVVDDDSPEPVTVPSRTSHGVSVQSVRRSTNGGPAAARMTGLAFVDTELVAFLDADCLPRPGWIEPLLEHFVDPNVVVVAPRITAIEPLGIPDHPVMTRYERAHASLDRGAERGRVRARTRISYVPSAALVCRVDALIEVGGFDESLTVGEDVDLVWRLDERGHTVRYEPSVTIGHRHRTTPWAWLRRRFDYGTSAGPLAKRHPGALAPIEASGWSLATWGLVASGHPLAGGAVVGATAGMLSSKLDGLSRPMPVAAQLAGRGHLSAGRTIAQGLLRPLWPVTALTIALIPWRRLKVALLAAVLAPPIIDWIRNRPDLAPLPYVGLRLADDIAYGTGVWVGAIRARTIEPLVPEVTSWPKPSRYTRWRNETIDQAERLSRR
jgi:mycofactocin system glycosyltransferase